MMRIIGLTGGIASGKSTVAMMLKKLGAAILDADQIGRDVVEPGQPALSDLVREFGDDVLLPDGRLDRKGLASRVFGHPEKVARLNEIVHPRIRDVLDERLESFREAGAWVAVIDAAVLLEGQLAGRVDTVWLVAADPELQVKRAAERSGMNEQEIRARMEAQMPLSEKLLHADTVLWNNGSMEELEEQVRLAWEKEVEHVRWRVAKQPRPKPGGAR